MLKVVCGDGECVEAVVIFLCIHLFNDLLFLVLFLKAYNMFV